MRSSKSPSKVLKKAFTNLPPKTLVRFVDVAFDSYIFNNSTYSKLEKNSLLDSRFQQPNQLFESIPKNSLFYYCVGILLRKKRQINEFISLEHKYNRMLFSGDYANAKALLDEISTIAGSSFWLETNSISTQAMIDKNCIDIDKYNSNEFVSLLLKHHITNINAVEQEDDLLLDLCDDTGSYNSSLNFVIYNSVGYHPILMKDAFSIISNTLQSTIIDLYKLLEIICLQELAGISSHLKLDDINYFLSHFQSSILSNILINYQTLEVQEEEMFAIDNYTDGNYQSVIDSTITNMNLNIENIRILASSLARTEYRLIPDCIYHSAANYLADVLVKKQYFTESSAKLSNLNVQFKNNIFLQLLSFRNLVETGKTSSNFEKAIDRTELSLSKVDSPFKLNAIFGRDKTLALYEDIPFRSSTYELFKQDVNTQPAIGSITQRQIKHYANQYIEKDQHEQAVTLYESVSDLNDCSMKKSYLIAVSKSGDTEKSAKLFIDFTKQHKEAANYFASKIFYETLVSRANSCNSPVLSNALFLCRNSGFDASLNRNATALSIRSYIKYLGIENPSDVSFLDSDQDELFFLEYVCNRELLSKSLLFRYQNDAFEERIRICNLLTNRKIGNINKLRFESKELSKKKVLDKAYKQISKSKVYADKDYIRTTTWDEFVDCYSNYINTNTRFDEIEKEFSVALARLNNSKKVDSLLLGHRIIQMSSYVVEYANIGKNEKSKNMFNLMRTVVDEYAFGIKGLNSYLSTRIRHGTLASTIINPLINQGVYLSDNTPKLTTFQTAVSRYAQNLESKIHDIQKEFQDEIKSLVDVFVNQLIQVTANGRGTVENLFDFNISQVDVLGLRKKLGNDPTENDCWNAVDRWLERKLRESCAKVTQQLNGQVKDKINEILISFSDKLEKLFSKNDSGMPSSLRDELVTTRLTLYKQLNIIKNWFDLGETEREETYELSIVLNIVESMLQIKPVSLINKTGLFVANSMLSSVVDVIHNLVENAVKHSKVDRSKLDISLIFDMNDAAISITVENNTRFDGDFEEENKRLAKYSEYIPDIELKEKLQIEGGTGIARIKSILRHDFKVEDKIRLKYSCNNKFIACTSVNKKCGVFVNENTNS